MSPLHSQTSVPQHGPQRWWVRKGSHDTRQNQFKTQHCAPGPDTIVPRVRWTEPDSWLQLRGATAAGQRHWTATALSRPRRKGTDPLTQFEHASWTRVKEALDKAKIQAWFTQRDTAKHVLTHPSLDRKATISQTTFQMNSREWRVSYFDLIFTDVDNKSMLVQAMDWHRVGDKPLPDTVHCRIEGVGMSWRG